MWDEVRAGIKVDGLFVLDQYLDPATVRSLIDSFEAIATSDEADQSAREKRGVVFARRNLLSLEFVRRFIDSPDVQTLVAQLHTNAIAVRGILFDKTGDANWTVPWHQDRSIAVQQRLDVPGFGPWSQKAGVTHVQPPVEILQAMLTLRFSLDPCGTDNGPLRAIPATHLQLMNGSEVDTIVEQQAERTCTTQAGGVVIMRPLLLHASSPATHVRRRRVLHIEFGPVELPGGLEWAKI